MAKSGMVIPKSVIAQNIDGKYFILTRPLYITKGAVTFYSMAFPFFTVLPCLNLYGWVVS